MADGGRSFKEKLEYQIALRKIESAFEACSKFGEADKQSLYEEIGNQLFQHVPRGPSEVPASVDEAQPRFSDRCLELADVAPSDDIREVLIRIADWCEVELEPIEDAPPPQP
jgi:hypothetical protein